MKQRKVMNALLYSIFMLYLFLLFTILFRGFRVGYSARSFNLIPFHTIGDYLFSNDVVTRAFALSNLLGNIVLFIPLGIYISLFNRNLTWRSNIAYILIFSLLVEVVQFTLNIGIGDIDDIILNTIGGIIGISIYKGLFHLLKEKEKVKIAIAFLALIGGILFFFYLYLENRGY